MKSLKAFLGALLLLASAAHATDLSRAVMLAAGEPLAGTAYAETVLIAAPLAQGGHIGFIVNRPTEVKLEDLFPEHAASRKVVEPVYFGGPIFTEGVFAVARKAPEGDGQVVALMPGLVAVLDGDSLDRVIETTPNDARYFAGLMLWRPGVLEEEVREGVWSVRPASVDAVLRGSQI
jgi:putative transcriptional regulator